MLLVQKQLRNVHNSACFATLGYQNCMLNYLHCYYYTFSLISQTHRVFTLLYILVYCCMLVCLLTRRVI